MFQPVRDPEVPQWHREEQLICGQEGCRQVANAIPHRFLLGGQRYAAEAGIFRRQRLSVKTRKVDAPYVERFDNVIGIDGCLHEDARLRLSGAPHTGRLRIGASEDLADTWLPEVLRCFGRQYPAVGVELEIGIGTTLFKMLQTRELDLVVGGRCDGQTQGRRLWKEPLVWAFSADAEVPKVLPLAFFPEPCPYREAALRALARTSRRWHIACTSSSLAGLRAACMAGLAVTPLPKHAIRPGLRVLAKTDNLPILPEVEYVSQTNERESRQIIATFDTLMQEKALR